MTLTQYITNISKSILLDMPSTCNWHWHDIFQAIQILLTQENNLSKMLFLALGFETTNM